MACINFHSLAPGKPQLPPFASLADGAEQQRLADPHADAAQQRLSSVSATLSRDMKFLPPFGSRQLDAGKCGASHSNDDIHARKPDCHAGGQPPTMETLPKLGSKSHSSPIVERNRAQMTSPTTSTSPPLKRVYPTLPPWKPCMLSPAFECAWKHAGVRACSCTCLLVWCCVDAVCAKFGVVDLQF